jgi:hypothetical protein
LTILPISEFGLQLREPSGSERMLLAEILNWDFTFESENFLLTFEKEPQKTPLPCREVKYFWERDIMSIEKLRWMVLTSLMAALTAVGAYIYVPIGPVPIVLSTLFAILSGLLLGSRWGLASMGL